MISGRTVNLGVIGHPIAHSLSPVMQNAAIERAGLDYAYIAMPVEPEDLPSAVAGLRALNFRGFNVTIPHKSAIIPFLDEISDGAKIIGAVNTVVNDGGRLIGHNTDVDGFIDAMHAKNVAAAGKSVALYGAGGAARAVICGLMRDGASEINVGVRNPSKAQGILKSFAPHGAIKIFDWSGADFEVAAMRADIIVNTTPLGMHPNIGEMPPVDFSRVKDDAFFYDIIYTPSPTRLMREARERGHEVLGGAAMLVRQGAVAFRLWTGTDADEGIMMEKLKEMLDN